MKTADKLIGAVSGLALVVFLLLMSFRIPSLSLWFYQNEFNKNNTYANMRMERSELSRVAQRVIDYLDGSNPDLAGTAAVVNGQERLFFNEKEVSHMVDVEVLFSWGIRLINICGAVSGLALLYFLIKAALYNRDGLFSMFGMWRGFAAGTLILFGTLGAVIALNFQRAFTIFHEIFFSNDLWLLNPNTDLLINMLPNQFFQDIAIFIGVLFVVLIILVIILAQIFRAAIKRNQNLGRHGR